MCLLIVEILMLIAGIWALVSGKLPSGLFKVLFGKGEYMANPRQARLIGLLLTSPIPLTFLGGLLLGVLFGADAVQYSAILEIFILIVVCILAVIIARKVKNQPVESVDKVA
ncbi:MAG: hypothetical protein GY805_14650 [Chloroflexi bacterium]|nr:hypothetical protein [Chloroflexota bacterium]